MSRRALIFVALFFAILGIYAYAQTTRTDPANMTSGSHVIVSGIQTYTCIDGWPADQLCTAPGTYRPLHFYKGF